MSAWLDKSRRRLQLLTVAAVLTVSVGVAFGYFSSTGAGTATAVAGTLSAPSGLTATPGAGTVALSWNSVTPPGAGPVSYYVTRNGGSPGGSCATLSAPSTATSCTDSGLTAGTYQYTVTAVWQSWTATSSPPTNVTLASGAASQIVLSGSTASLGSGSTRTFTATIEDAAGNTITSGPDSTDSITFAQTAGTGTVTGLSTVSAVAGVATDTITGNLVGSVTLQASGTVNGSATSSSTLTFTVTVGTASQIVLSGSTANLASGSTRTFTATIEDANGNTITSGPDSTDSITFAQTAGTGTVTGLSTVSAVAGVATDTITGNLVGSVTLQASGTVNGSATSSSTLTFTVTVGTASQIVLSGSTANLASGSTRTFTATIEDANGNTITTGPDSADPITFAQTTGSGTVTGLSTVPAVAGVATDTITGKLAGPVTLQASANLSVPGTTNSNPQTFTVIAGTASQIVLSGSTASLGSGSTRTFTATIEDAAGNTVTSGPDATDSITFAQTTGSGTVTGLSTVPAVAGVATDTITGKLAGPVTLQASANLSVPGTTNSNPQTFTVIAGPATQIAVVTGSGQTTAPGTAFTNPLVAVVKDAAGNPVSGAQVTFTGPSSGASGSFATCAGGNPATYKCVVTTDSNGDATSSTFTANATTGSYNVAASASGTNTVNFALSNVANVLVITSAPVSGAASGTANLGAITVQQQTTGGTPVNAGTGGLTVNLSGPTGSSFATSQFGASITSVTIPSGSSSTTFWYGNSSAGTPTITASASGLSSATQKETITTAPVGLGIVITGGTGTPVVSCGTPSSSYTCNISGVGQSGSVTFYVTFVNSSGTPVVYSASQASTITESGENTGTVTIAAGASSSSPNMLTASHTGNSVKTTTLTFGSSTLTINVSS